MLEIRNIIFVILLVLPLSIVAGGKVCVHNSGEYILTICVYTPLNLKSIKCSHEFKEGFNAVMKYKNGQRLVIYADEHNWNKISHKKLNGGNIAYYVTGEWAFTPPIARQFAYNNCH